MHIQLLPMSLVMVICDNSGGDGSDGEDGGRNEHPMEMVTTAAATTTTTTTSISVVSVLFISLPLHAVRSPRNGR